MQKLIETIQMLRQKLPKLRGTDLKEYPTRTILIDPLLEALGWDVADPDEVKLEYSTCGGRVVDYALLLNGQPVLLVEAKPLDDPLSDVKAITQVVGYAANAGIEWCILTNGVLWRVYKSMEKCPAEEKLLFEVDIDPPAPGGPTVEQIARQMWLFSREEMAKNTLDAIGEQKFTDSKVRKALEALLANPPKKLLILLRQTIGASSLKFPQLKESLGRIMAEQPWLSGGQTVGAPPPKLAADRPARCDSQKTTGGKRRTSAERLPRGRRTPEDAYRRPILEALSELGGQAPMSNVLDLVEKKMASILNQYDRQPLPSEPRTLRWRNTAQWCRNTLVREGLLKSDSPHGVWELTEAGWRELKKQS